MITIVKFQKSEGIVQKNNLHTLNIIPNHYYSVYSIVVMTLHFFIFNHFSFFTFSISQFLLHIKIRIWISNFTLTWCKCEHCTKMWITHQTKKSKKYAGTHLLTFVIIYIFFLTNTKKNKFDTVCLQTYKIFLFLHNNIYCLESKPFLLDCTTYL